MNPSVPVPDPEPEAIYPPEEPDPDELDEDEELELLLEDMADYGTFVKYKDLLFRPADLCAITRGRQETNRGIVHFTGLMFAAGVVQTDITLDEMQRVLTAAGVPIVNIDIDLSDHAVDDRRRDAEKNNGGPVILSSRNR